MAKLKARIFSHKNMMKRKIKFIVAPIFNVGI